MRIKYNRDDIDEKLSMGENALLYYDNILEKNVLNRVIISTILELHKKGYVELNNTKENELVIEIKKGTKDLRISETFIYECLRFIDADNDSIVTLDEFNAYENDVFARHKKNIKELIIQEAMVDELIDIEKFKKKRKHFFRTLEILVILIMSMLVEFINPIKAIILVITIIVISTLMGTNYLDEFITYSKDSLKKLKNKLLNEEIMKYSSKTKHKNIMIEFVTWIIIYYIHFYFLEEIFTYIENIFIIETLIILILAIVEYIKFHKVDIYTDKAILNRQKLKGLGEYLKEYSLIENRKAIEIYLWEDYLIFSVLLGINNNITNEMKLNLDNNRRKKSEIQYDYYENRYFYMNDKDEKVYID